MMRLADREKYFQRQRGVVTHADLAQDRKAEAASEKRKVSETKKQAKEAAKGAALFEEIS